MLVFFYPLEPKANPNLSRLLHERGHKVEVARALFYLPY
jgi:hypothetical protein